MLHKMISNSELNDGVHQCINISEHRMAVSKITMENIVTACATYKLYKLKLMFPVSIAMLLVIYYSQHKL